MPLPIILALISLIPEIPSLIDAVTKLVERGQAKGELSAGDAAALTVIAQSLFAKYSQPAPPPPGVNNV